jgi:hypothetical protein
LILEFRNKKTATATDVLSRSSVLPPEYLQALSNEHVQAAIVLVDGRRIRSGVIGGEVAKSYNCARNNENNNNLGFGSSALAIGGLAHDCDPTMRTVPLHCSR